MSEDEAELKEIKQQIDQKLWRRGLLAAHVIIWIIGCGIVAILAEEFVPIIAVAWLGLILLHALLVYLWDKRDHDIETELMRRAQVRSSEKLKRDRLYRLSDDGELVEVEDEDQREVQKNRR